MKPRSSSHAIETRSRDSIRSQIDSYYKNGDALFRELSERDYGIDAVIELFDQGIPTGKFSLIQIKGTEKTIQPLKKGNCVSCQISSSNAMYAIQKHIPVFLIYTSITKSKGFYFVNIQKALTQQHFEKMQKQKEITIRIPIENNAMESLEPLFNEINQFYKQLER